MDKSARNILISAVCIIIHDMENLHQLQTLFHDALKGDLDAKSKLSTLVVGTKNLSSSQRVEIYQGNVTFTLTQALQKTYPILRKIIGGKKFSELALSYITKYTSKSQNLDTYGEFFPDLLQEMLNQHPEFSPYIPDLAKLEWLYSKSYFAPKSASFCFQTFSEMAAKDPEGLVLGLSQNIFFMSSLYPVHKIWEKQLEEKPESTLEVKPGENLSYLVIYKHENLPRVEVVSKEEYFLMQYIKEGKSLGELASQCLENGIALNKFLPKFIELGWVDEVYMCRGTASTI